MISAPKFPTQVTACFAWLALALCSLASPSLVLTPTQAGVEEYHAPVSHAVFLEEAGEDSESRHYSDDSSSDGTPVLEYSFRFARSCSAAPFSAAGQRHGREIRFVFAARGPPTA